MVLAVSRSARSGTDLEWLQGSWESIAGQRASRLLIAGRRFAFEFLGGDVFIGSLSLDVSTSPRRMDLWIEEGPEEYRGQMVYCIYHLDEEGKTLRWCPTRPGAVKRLTSFPSTSDPKSYCTVFQRVSRRRFC